jgi:membrane-associated protein
VLVVSTLILGLGVDPQRLLHAVGLIGLLLAVFAESGMMVGFFLPGDSLLFAAGLLTYRGDLAAGQVWLVTVGCVVAAVVGDQVGYGVGRKLGPRLADRERSRFPKDEHLAKAQAFFDRHGPKAIALSRFVPIVRTFCPVVAGVSRMDHRVFTRWNVIGGVVWAVGLIQLGYWLGRIAPGIGDRMELVVVAIVVFSLIPIGVELIRSRRARVGSATGTPGR